MLYVGSDTTANEIVSGLFEVILSNGFPQLRICTGVNIKTLVSSNKWKESPALLTLHLDMETVNDYEQLLSACPRLRRFTSYQRSWVDLPKSKVSYFFHKNTCQTK